MHHHFIVTGFSVCNCIPPYDEGYYIRYIYIVLALCLNAKGGANMPFPLCISLHHGGGGIVVVTFVPLQYRGCTLHFPIV